MLVLTGLTKSFEGRRVLSGLDLAVSPGESVALLGGNGSGKTTMLRAIVGLTRPDGGRILVDGIDALGRPKEARTRLSFLPQKSVFPSVLRVREVLQVTARLRALPGSRVGEEIERCGLQKIADQPVGTLSGGERQRVGLAVALLPDVPLYLFDEPSANLDPPSLGIFLQRARRLFEEGRTVLFTTHVPADVEALATRVEILAEGRLQSGQTPAFFGEDPVGASFRKPGSLAAAGGRGR